MMYLTVTAVAIALSAVLFLPLLPRQKEEVARLAGRPRSRCAGRLMAALLALLVVVGTGFAVLPIVPQTACLRLAGGAGCELEA